MDEEATLRLLLDEVIDGREGCFCLTSSRDMPAAEALRVYRSKDAVEKLFHSLKSEIEVKPIRVWSDDAVYGVLLLGFIAQLMISLTRWTVGPAGCLKTTTLRVTLQIEGAGEYRVCGYSLIAVAPLPKTLYQKLVNFAHHWPNRFASLYAKRVHAETVFSMIGSLLGYRLRCRSKNGRKNEVRVKLALFNLIQLAMSKEFWS